MASSVLSEEISGNFLYLYRADSGSREYLWIDQISINQADLGERSRQVRLMGHIFKTATQVIVWLGRNSNPGLAHIGSEIRATIHEHVKQHDAEQSIAWERCHARHCLIFPKLARSGLEAAIKTVNALVNLTYWRRLWIIQELALAVRVSIFINRQHIDKLDLCRVFGILQTQSFNYDGRVHNGTALLGDGNFGHVLVLLNWSGNQTRTICSVLCTVYDKETEVRCTDRRDLIYGLLGFVGSGPGLRVDYTLSTAEVFGNLLELLVSETDEFLTGKTPPSNEVNWREGRRMIQPLTRLVAVLGLPIRWQTVLRIEWTVWRDPVRAFASALSGFLGILARLKAFGLEKSDLNADDVLTITNQVLCLYKGKVEDWWQLYEDLEYHLDEDLICFRPLRQNHLEPHEVNRLTQLVRIADRAKLDCLEKAPPFTLPDLPLSAYDEPVTMNKASASKGTSRSIDAARYSRL